MIMSALRALKDLAVLVAVIVVYLVALALGILAIGALPWLIFNGGPWWQWVLMVVAFAVASGVMAWFAERAGIIDP